MIVRTLMDDLKTVYTNSGDLKRPEYIRVDESDGTVYLKKVGEIDINEEINSNRPVPVAEYINRYLRGDSVALGDPSRAQYGDVSHIRSLEDVVDIAQDFEQYASAPVVTPVENSVESEVKADAES